MTLTDITFTIAYIKRPATEKAAKRLLSDVGLRHCLLRCLWYNGKCRLQSQHFKQIIICVREGGGEVFSPTNSGFWKFLGQSLKFWQTLFAVSMLVRCYPINQSIIIVVKYAFRHFSYDVIIVTVCYTSSFGSCGPERVYTEDIRTTLLIHVYYRLLYIYVHSHASAVTFHSDSRIIFHNP